MQAIPSVPFSHEVYMEYTDGETECDKDRALTYPDYYSDHPTKTYDYSPYSYMTSNYVTGDVTVDFEKEPKIKPGEQFT